MSLVSGSGITIRGSGSLVGGKEGSDIGEGVRMLSCLSSSADSGPVALSSKDNTSTSF